jgi:SAM-dependent methyltransferase
MRSWWQVVKDTFSFPVRAVTLFEKDKFGFSSLQTERYDYVSGEVKGKCLDIGCGRNNRFITEFRKNIGVGIDVYKYEGLSKENIVFDMTKLPFDKNVFDTVTLIANINHIPKKIRKKELKEIFRVLNHKGKIIVTMGNPVVEVVVHKLVWFYDKFLKTNFDVDTERGMDVDEEYYLSDEEIKSLLFGSGFVNIKKKYFLSQWFLNHMFIAEKQ